MALEFCKRDQDCYFVQPDADVASLQIHEGQTNDIKYTPTFSVCPTCDRNVLRGAVDKSGEQEPVPNYDI
jgi:hypothetical protein